MSAHEGFDKVVEALELARAALMDYLIFKQFSTSDADDIIQDAYLIVIRKLAGGQLQHENLANADQMRAYLFSTVKLLILEWRRKQARTVSLDTTEFEIAEDAGVGRLKALKESIQDRILDEAMQKLTEADRDLVAGWRRKESEQAAADRLGVALGTIKMRRFRARNRFVELVGKSNLRQAWLEVVSALHQRDRNR